MEDNDPIEGAEMIASFLEVAHEVPDDAFVPIEDVEQLPPDVRGDSLMWSQRFFAEMANPYNEALTVRRSLNLATDQSTDLLRHEYTVDDLSLVVIETNNFTIISIKGTAAGVLALPEPARAVAVNTLAQRVLMMRGDDYHWEFDYPNTIKDGTHFSTAPDVDPWMLSPWSQRADGGLRGDDVYFLCFKKYEQTSGYEDMETWFDDEFRAQHQNAKQIP